MLPTPLNFLSKRGQTGHSEVDSMFTPTVVDLISQVTYCCHGECSYKQEVLSSSFMLYAVGVKRHTP